MKKAEQDKKFVEYILSVGIEELKENIYGNDEIHLMFEEEIEKLKAVHKNDTNVTAGRLNEIDKKLKEL